MKKSLLVTCFTFLLFNAMAQPLENTIWYLSGGPPFGLFENDTLKISPDGGDPIDAGTYVINGSTISITDIPPFNCGPIVGQYSFTISSGILDFDLVDDACTARQPTFLDFIWSSVPTGITDLETEIEIHAYPNPVIEQLTIRTKDELIGTPFEILTYDGRKILQGQIESDNTTVPFHEISSGIYLLRIEGSHVVTKIFKR